MQIHLLHVNDVHSQLENYMRLGSQLRTLRTSLQSDGHIVFTFDLGDLLDRVRPETEASMGMQSVEMLASLGVDGWVFGNNEGLTIPTGDWPLLVDKADTSVFGTNLKNHLGQPFDFFEQYHIFEKQGVRVGVFGLTPNYRLPYNMLGVDAEDPFLQAAQMVRLLTDRSCDVIVCLSHLGRNTDKRLASVIPGIHVILGGHTHEFMTEAELVGSTAIFQPGKFARVFGHTTVFLDKDNGVQSVHAQAVPVKLDTPYDALMFRAYQAYLPRTKSILSRPVAKLSEPLAVKYDEESLFPNLLADVLNDEFPGDFALMMTGALNASLLPGQINLENLLSACPTPTRPIVLTIQGRHILHVLEQGVQASTYNRHGIGFGFRGGKIGVLVVSGATVFVRESKETRTVEAVKIGEEYLDPDRDYQLITCEYMWLSPVFSEFQKASVVSYQPPLVREVLLARLQDEVRLDKAKEPRYQWLQDDRKV